MFGVRDAQLIVSLKARIARTKTPFLAINFRISRVRTTTNKGLAFFRGLGHSRTLIFAHAICATRAHPPSARRMGFCINWVCISLTSS
jgi:hypothetical protein